MERISAPFWASCGMICGDRNPRRAQELEMLEMVIFWLIWAAAGREEMAVDNSVLMPQRTTWYPDLQCQYLRGRGQEEYWKTEPQQAPWVQTARGDTQETAAGPLRQPPCRPKRGRAERRMQTPLEILLIRNFQAEGWMTFTQEI